MDELLVITCNDGACCCLNPRASVVAISLLGMGVCIPDLVLAGACITSCLPCPMKTYVETGRVALLTLFQVASTLLFVACIVENVFLVKLYVWYTLSFVVLALIMAIFEFLCQYKEENKLNVVRLVLEVAFLFVLYRCLPIVDHYRIYLESSS